MMKNHVLVDLETLAVGHNAALLSIGAVRFDNNGLYETFYQNIDPLDGIQQGARADQRTMDWWKAQDPELQNLTSADPKPLAISLAKFTAWFTQVPNSYIWGFGPSFDCAILEDNYKLCKLKTPWTYRNERCGRTIVQFDPEKKHKKQRKPGHYEHHALYDAIYEAGQIVAVLKEFNLQLP
jgi:hypothetical protein